MILLIDEMILMKCINEMMIMMMILVIIIINGNDININD